MCGGVPSFLLVEHNEKSLVIRLTVIDKGNYRSTKVCTGQISFESLCFKTQIPSGKVFRYDN